MILDLILFTDSLENNRVKTLDDEALKYNLNIMAVIFYSDEFILQEGIIICFHINNNQYPRSGPKEQK